MFGRVADPPAAPCRGQTGLVARQDTVNILLTYCNILARYGQHTANIQHSVNILVTCSQHTVNILARYWLPRSVQGGGGPSCGALSRARRVSVDILSIYGQYTVNILARLWQDTVTMLARYGHHTVTIQSIYWHDTVNIPAKYTGTSQHTLST